MTLINIARAGAISDAPRLAEVLINALKFLLSIFGPLAIICLVIAGLLYLTAGGSEKQIDKAKKMTYFAVVGIIIALSSLIILKNIAKIISG